MRIVDENEVTALRTERIRARLDAEDAAFRVHRRAPAHRFIRPKTRKRWLPPVLTAMASGALTLAIVNFTHLNGGDGGPPVDNHPTVSQIVNGYGQPIPVPAPSVADSSSKTTKTPAATQSATTGETVVGVQGTAQDARTSTGSGSGTKSSGAGDTSSSSKQSTGSKSSSRSSQGSGSKPASTAPANDPPASSGDDGGSTTTAPPANSDPTPEPTQDAGPVRTLLGGVGTVVGDLGDTVGGTLNGVGGLLGGGQSDEG